MTGPDIVRDSRTTSLLSLLRGNDMVVRICRTKSENWGEESRDIVRALRTISTAGRYETLSYFLEHGAATAWILRFRLGLPKRTVYDHLELLRALGVIIPQTQVKPKDRTRPPTIWGLPECTGDQIKAAYQLHLRLLSPKYRLAEKVVQDLLKPHIAEVSYRDIVNYVKQQGLGFRAHDIADIAAQYLHEQGIKVWR